MPIPTDAAQARRREGGLCSANLALSRTKSRNAKRDNTGSLARCDLPAKCTLSWVGRQREYVVVATSDNVALKVFEGRTQEPRLELMPTRNNTTNRPTKDSPTHKLSNMHEATV